MRMQIKGLRVVLGAAAISVISIGAAAAATVGIAVTGNNSDTAVAAALTINDGSDRTTTANLAGVSNSDVIGYYIPLADLGTCTYGSGCGVTYDSGDGTTTGGGTSMDMWIKYSNVSGGDSQLNLFFEDLDLIDANDPYGFFEDVTIFDTSGAQIAFVDEISDPGVSGSASTQQVVSLSLGNLTAGNDYWTKLSFTARYRREGWNTPEFLVAEISAVPVPAAGLMLLSGIAGLGFARRKRRAA